MSDKPAASNKRQRQIPQSGAGASGESTNQEKQRDEEQLQQNEAQLQEPPQQESEPEVREVEDQQLVELLRQNRLRQM